MKKSGDIWKTCLEIDFIFAVTFGALLKITHSDNNIKPICKLVSPLGGQLCDSMIYHLCYRLQADVPEPPLLFSTIACCAIG